MSETATPSYTVAANLFGFALIYVVALIAAALVADVLQSVGVTLPEAGLGIAIYAGVVALSGHRFAERREWTSRDRNLLSLSYTIIAATISCVLVSALIFVDPSISVSLGVAAEFAGIIAVVFIVILLIHFVLARFLLAIIARRANREDTANRGNK